MLALVHIVIVIVVLVGTIVLFRRTGSIAARVAIVIGAPIAALAGLFASTVAMVGDPVERTMGQLRRVQPVATILEADPAMERPLRDAVRRGLTTPTADGRRGKEALDASLSAVLEPYVMDRMRHARDGSVIASGRNLRDRLVDARTRGGPTACAAVLTSRTTLETLSAPWVLDMIRAGREPEPRIATAEEVRVHMAAVTTERGRTAFEVLGAFRGMGPLACDLPIEAIDHATALPEANAAAMLRAMGLPRPA